VTVIVGEDAVASSRRGETLRIPERVVVAPCGGVFEPHPPVTVTTEGEIVEVGQVVGVLRSSGTDVAVRTPFAGFLIEMLAASGERVREGQPIAWLRVFNAAT
jgi:biotin carboxyl carrier protein